MRRCRHCGSFLRPRTLRACRAREGQQFCALKPLVPKPNLVEAVAKKNYESIRGRDRAKLDIKWEDPEILFEKDGKRVARLHTPGDVRQFGRLMGHCAGDHHHRVAKGDWHFITILTEDNVPHATIHAKHIELQGTNDGYTGSSPRYPEKVTIQNHTCFLVAGYTKGGWGQSLATGKYGEVFKGWLAAAKPKDATPLKVSGYAY